MASELALPGRELHGVIIRGTARGPKRTRSGKHIDDFVGGLQNAYTRLAMRATGRYDDGGQGLVCALDDAMQLALGIHGPLRESGQFLDHHIYPIRLDETPVDDYFDLVEAGEPVIDSPVSSDVHLFFPYAHFDANRNLIDWVRVSVDPMTEMGYVIDRLRPLAGYLADVGKRFAPVLPDPAVQSTS